MRDTEASGWMMQALPDAGRRALRLTAVALGIGFVMTVSVARAQDDNDDRSFEEKIIDNIMGGIGAKTMDNRGIDYRERSPLVVPPKLDLPPPESDKAAINDPSWPKDPDEQQRKAAIAARKKAKPSSEEAARLLTPAELNVGRTRSSSTATDPVQPGQPNGAPLSAAQLGYTGGLMGIFHGNKQETAPFKGEPTRESLTQPPPGYQTPSPNFAYGTGPLAPLGGKHLDVMTGKEVDN